MSNIGDYEKTYEVWPLEMPAPLRKEAKESPTKSPEKTETQREREKVLV